MPFTFIRTFFLLTFIFTSSSQATSQCSSAKMPFIKNIGQAPKHVEYYINTPSADLYFNKEAEINYSFKLQNTIKSFVITETLLNAKPILSPLKKQNTQINILKGKNKAHKNVPSYSEISLGQPWKGIDMKISTRPGNIEKLFILKPQADVSLIKIELEGQKKLTINNNGELIIETSSGDFAFTKPIAWQVINNDKIPVEVNYVIDKNNYGFHLGDYNKSHKVIIDPLIASSYVGGNGIELVGEKFINNNDEIIIAGASSSTNFPIIPGSFSETNLGEIDFIALKFNSTMCELIAMTYFGGNGTDQARVVTYDEIGNIYFAGDTSSTDFPLPDLPYQPYQEANNANGSIFIAALSADFTQVLGATHIGGDIVDMVRDIQISPNGNIYVSGFTNSNDFPYTNGAFESTGKGAIISAFNPDLSELLYSTRLGGGDNDSIAFDTDGSLFVITNKFSTSDYTTTAGVYDTAPSGGSGVPNKYIAHMTEDLSTLLAATFIGIGSVDDILITGDELLLSTSSSNISFTDILKMDKGLTTITASLPVEISGGLTYHIEQDGNILVLGTAGNANFLELPDPIDPTSLGYHGGSADLVLVRIDDALTVINSFLFIGGSHQEYSPGNIIKDSNGDIIVSGITKSNDLFTSPFAFGKSYGGQNDFLVQIIPNNFIYSDLSTDLIFCNGFESPVGCSCN